MTPNNEPVLTPNATGVLTPRLQRSSGRLGAGGVFVNPIQAKLAKLELNQLAVIT
jgi:hypothetical protein